MNFFVQKWIRDQPTLFEQTHRDTDHMSTRLSRAPADRTHHTRVAPGHYRITSPCYCCAECNRISVFRCFGLSRGAAVDADNLGGLMLWHGDSQSLGDLRTRALILNCNRLLAIAGIPIAASS